jgi:hypothetical protein
MGDNIEDFEDDDAAGDFQLPRKRKAKEESEDEDRNDEERMRELHRLKASMHFHTAQLAEGNGEETKIKIKLH